MLGGAGIVMVGTSISFFASSDRLEKQAIQIQPIVSVENIYLPSHTNIQPSVGLAIKL